VRKSEKTKNPGGGACRGFMDRKAHSPPTRDRGAQLGGERCLDHVGENFHKTELSSSHRELASDLAACLRLPPPARAKNWLLPSRTAFETCTRQGRIDVTGTAGGRTAQLNLACMPVTASKVDDRCRPHSDCRHARFSNGWVPSATTVTAWSKLGDERPAGAWAAHLILLCAATPAPAP